MSKTVRKTAKPSQTDGPIEIRPLIRSDWPVIEKLFGAKGACGGCWCMLWRAASGGKAFEEQKGEPNRKAFRALIRAGKVHGMLAFAEDVPIGWCSFGPAESFPRMLQSRVLQRPRSSTTWSITCFYVTSKWRGCGVGTRLLEGAVKTAFELGATEVEGFPVVPKSDQPMPAAFAWTGVPPMYAPLGFVEQPNPPGARPIYVCARGGSVMR
jgi:GNAT superfamily N-acetyltransferase